MHATVWVCILGPPAQLSAFGWLQHLSQHSS